MIEYLSQWPLSVSETLGLVAFLAGIAAFLWRAGRRVERGIERLDDGLKAYAVASERRSEELAARVAALETQVRTQTAQEGAVLATLSSVQHQVATMSNRLDGLVSALLRRPD